VNSDVKRGFFIGLGVMGALVAVGFATGLISKAL
jgi:hypothetical protein